MGVYEQQKELRETKELEGRRKKAKRDGRVLVKEYKRSPKRPKNDNLT